MWNVDLTHEEAEFTCLMGFHVILFNVFCFHVFMNVIHMWKWQFHMFFHPQVNIPFHVRHFLLIMLKLEFSCETGTNTWWNKSLQMNLSASSASVTGERTSPQRLSILKSGCFSWLGTLTLVDSVGLWLQLLYSRPACWTTRFS